LLVWFLPVTAVVVVVLEADWMSLYCITNVVSFTAFVLVLLFVFQNIMRRLLDRGSGSAKKRKLLSTEYGCIYYIIIMIRTYTHKVLF
jgi:hypothetical protein